MLSNLHQLRFAVSSAVLTMSTFNWRISLICPDGNHDPIKLPHRELVYIGRSPDTRIVDPRCSRKQIQMCADLNTGDVQVVQLGQNSSALDGMEMIKDKVYMMKPNSMLQVLTGQFPQKLDMKRLKESDDKKHRHKSSSEVDASKLSSGHVKSTDRLSSSCLTPGSSNQPSLKHHKRKSEDKQGSSSAKKPKITEESKKAKVNGETTSRTGSSSKERHNSMDDDGHLKNVSAKLDMMKALAKGGKTPSKPSSSVDTDSKVHKVTPLKENSGFKVPQSPAQYASAAPFKYPTWQGPAPESRWDQYESLYIYTTKGLEHREKIAGFDIDGTIITTKSGKRFPTDCRDWTFLYHNEKLKRLHSDGRYKVVFFTNQLGVSKGKASITDLKTKFEDVVRGIGVPVQILVSTKAGLYRKPCTGMWTFLTEQLNGGIKVDMSNSFYVGDAAGRAKDWMPKKKKDFSCSDRLFALNLGIEFKTPEEYFKGYPAAKYTIPSFDPRSLSSSIQLLEPGDAKLVTGCQEVILLCGFPACGKSFFAKKYLEPRGYVYVNRDTLGSQPKCIAACKEGLKKGQCVVVDNTNPDVDSRAKYLALAKEYRVPCRCFVFKTSTDHVRHNERFREITDKSHTPINDMIINSFAKKYVPPEKTEGFAEIVSVNFLPKFSDPELEKLYRMFLMEK